MVYPSRSICSSDLLFFLISKCSLEEKGMLSISIFLLRTQLSLPRAHCVMLSRLLTCSEPVSSPRAMVPNWRILCSLLFVGGAVTGRGKRKLLSCFNSYKMHCHWWWPRILYIIRMPRLYLTWVILGTMQFCTHTDFEPMV